VISPSVEGPPADLTGEMWGTLESWAGIRMDLCNVSVFVLTVDDADVGANAVIA